MMLAPPTEGENRGEGEELPAEDNAQHVDRGLPAHLAVFDDIDPERPNDHAKSESRARARAFPARCASFSTAPPPPRTVATGTMVTPST